MSERIIKKYPNRRLYDTTLRAYITLDDVKKLVFDHAEFKVIDARTDKDLTQSTLLQIITEQEATSTPIFTTVVLQEFIRFYHKKSHHALSEYLEQVMNLYVHQKDFFQKQWFSYQNLFTDPLLLQKALMMQKKPAVKKTSRRIHKSKEAKKKESGRKGQA